MAEPITYTLKRKPEVDPSTVVIPQFVVPAFGEFPFPHDYLKPHVRGGHFGDNGNEISMTMVLRAKYLHDALFFILGYAKKNSDSGAGIPLTRVLPIRIPMDATFNYSHWGMIAKEVTGIRVRSDTGLTGENAPTGYETFNSGSRLHQTVPETSPALDLIDNDDPLRRNYLAEIDITFWHPLYRCQSDSYVAGDPLGERGRFTYCTFVGGIEYASLPTGVIKWGPDAPSPSAGHDAREATGGAGQVVPTGAVTVRWFKVPREVVGDLLDLWIDEANSTINAAPMQFYIYDKLVTFAESTLLFIPPQSAPEPKWLPTGEIYYDIDYTFMYRKNTWNKMLHPNGNYYTIERQTGGGLYDATDLTRLFDPY